MSAMPAWRTCRYATCDTPATFHHRVTWLRRDPFIAMVRLDPDEADYCAAHSYCEWAAAAELLRERRIAAPPTVTRL
jgi:hypothetical protein